MTQHKQADQFNNDTQEEIMITISVARWRWLATAVLLWCAGIFMLAVADISAHNAVLTIISVLAALLPIASVVRFGPERRAIIVARRSAIEPPPPVALMPPARAIGHPNRPAITSGRQSCG
jgi:hypothetical protein